MNQQGNVIQVVQVDDYHIEGIGETQYGWSVSCNKNNIYTSGPFKGNGIFNGVDTLSGSGSFLARLSMENPQSVNTYKIDPGIDFVYPNPASEFIIIDMPGEINNEFTLYIINSGGMLVKTLHGSKNKMHIDINSLPPGTYSISITGNKFMYIKKIIIL